MSLSLKKGGSLSLKKAAPGLKKIRVGLGWDPRRTPGKEFDLDASAFLLSSTGRVRSEADLVFYNQLASAHGEVQHMGDNRSGVGEGDDEQILIDLSALDAATGTKVDKIAVTVTIHEYKERQQNFGMVSNAYIRVLNEENGEELARYDLSEDASTETSMIFGEVYRDKGEWHFRAAGEGSPGGLEELCAKYGVSIE